MNKNRGRVHTNNRSSNNQKWTPTSSTSTKQPRIERCSCGNGKVAWLGAGRGSQATGRSRTSNKSIGYRTFAAGNGWDLLRVPCVSPPPSFPAPKQNERTLPRKLIIPPTIHCRIVMYGTFHRSGLTNGRESERTAVPSTAAVCCLLEM